MKEADLKRLYIASIQLYNILEKTNQRIKKHKHHFVHEGLYSQSYGFSCSHAWMWELDHKEGWVPKNWCFWTVVLEKTLDSHSDSKEIKPVNPKGNQLWIFIWKIDTEAKAPILWPLDWKRPWFWETLKAKGEESGRGWEGWKASQTQWTWTWTNSRRY